jgi:hypothetical protein
MNTRSSAVSCSRRALLRGAVPVALAVAGATGVVPGLARVVSAREATPAAAATPAVEQLHWFLDRLAGGDLTESEVADRFSPIYLTAIPSGEPVPAAGVIGRVGLLAETLGPVTLQDFLAPPEQTPNQAYGLLVGDGTVYTMILTVEPEAPHRILDVLVSPLELDLLAAPPAPPADWDAFAARLAAAAPEASFLAAEIVGGEIQPIHGYLPDTQLSVGSTFKLYILGELGRRVAAGEAAWDEPLAIRDDWKSLPSSPLGDPMAYEPAGAEHTLREYAEQMIAVSGNTATDHLLLHLGREAVETTMADMGHAEPDLTTPMLATREVFALSLALPDDDVAAYIEADDTERRALLDEVVRPAGIAPVQAIDWVGPRDLEEIGWFASAGDLCRAMAALRLQAEQSDQPPILDILALNPGFDPGLVDAAAWTWIGHKGGALPGAVSRTWLLERADGRTFVLSATLNSPEAPQDLLTPDLVMSGAFDLLATWEGDPATPQS